MKVLLVDDEQEFVSTLVERLRMRRVEAQGVTSGKAAIEKVREQAYDVVVIDLKMAGLGGVETMQRIQAIQPETRFIILTGHTDQRDMARGLETGARFHLMKPTDIEVLLEKIRQCGEQED
jgi:DNA-binding response OmpR family regulator